jgi:hypothetical protein
MIASIKEDAPDNHVEIGPRRNENISLRITPTGSNTARDETDTKRSR